MSSLQHDFLFDVNFGFGSEGLVSTFSNIEGNPPPPPIEGFFLLLDDSNFLLLNGQNLALL